MGAMERLREEMTAKAEEIKAVLEPFGDDEEVPAEEYQRVLALTGELKALKKRVTDAAATTEAKGEVGELLKFLSDPTGRGMTHTGPRDVKDSLAARRALQSLGQRFASSDEFMGWLKSVSTGDGRIPDRAKLHSPAVAYDSQAFLKKLNQKALITGVSDTSGGALVFNDVQDGLTMLGRRPLTIRDVITVGQTSSDTVEYVSVTAETNNAATVAEATATSGSSGTKPESGFTLAKVTTAVKTIAHWIPATRRALADAGQIRTLIDNFLEFGLEEELEDQIVAGDGTGENFLGIANLSGTQAQAFDTDILTTTRKAKTKVRVTGRAIPTAFLLNPADWETIDLAQDNEGRYYYGGPARMGEPVLWGTPVVESEAVPAGTGYVGDLRQCVLWDREAANILVSDSHNDFFTRNLVAILAELRAAFGCLRPVGIVEIDLAA